MGSFLTALIALAGIYVVNFVAEDYRRFRDGSSLAAGLAGELSSYLEAYATLSPLLEDLSRRHKNGERMLMLDMGVPPDPFYESNVGKLGLLGPEFAENTAFVYQNLKAFRSLFSLTCRKHLEMETGHIAIALDSCNAALGRAHTRGVTLVANLKARAIDEYPVPYPWRWFREPRPTSS